MKVEMECLFEFQSKLLDSYFLARPVNLFKEDDLKLIRGDFKNIEFPIVFKQSAGKKMSDVLDTERPWLYLISGKLKNTLEVNNLTGWKTYPIKLYDKKDNEIHGYYGFSVAGRSGPIYYDESKILEEKKVPTGPLVKYFKGRFIDPESWDGSDFFLPEGTIGITVNGKTAEMLKKEKISNLVLDPLVDQKTRVADVLGKKTSS